MNEVVSAIIAVGRELGALTVRTDPPFTWASGARMPVYNDNRRLLSDPRGRSAVRAGLASLVVKHHIVADAVAGTASAGIAPATLLAEEVGAPLYYVRGTKKDHGRARQIEGAPDEGLAGYRVILVEDLISTGGSSAAAAEALAAAGATVVACLAIFTYGFSEARERFAAVPGAPPVYTILSADLLIADGESRGWLSSSEVAVLRDWQRDPFGWYGHTGAPAVTVRTPEVPAARSPSTAIRSVLTTTAQTAGNLLCVGLDPRVALIPDRGATPAGVEAVAPFLRGVVDEIAESGVTPAAFKPNVAFFHQLDRPRQGVLAGSRALAELLHHLHTVFPAVPVILDAKRGDVAETSDAYAREAFIAWDVEAVTVAPFMGDDSVGPFLEAAGTADRPRWVYLLNRTSNPGAERFQNLPVGTPPRPFSHIVAEAIQEWQARYGTAGAVIGATAPTELRDLLQIYREQPIPILIPGIGAQGGGAEEVLAAISEAGYPPGLVRINMSRHVTFPWGSSGTIPTNWREAVRDSFMRAA
ncbi:MAG: orotidine-5'-phosphate decarboxylase, partial [Alkalispirochaeta sp.]